MSKHRPRTRWYRFMRMTRPIRYFMIYPLLEMVRWVAGRLSHAQVLRLGRWVGGVWAVLGRRSRRRAMTQLERAGLDLDPAARRAVCDEIFRQLGMNVLEWLHSLRWSAEQVNEHVCFEHCVPIIRQAQALGRGLIFVSAHMGNWELLPRAYHATLGQGLAVVMADTPHGRLTQWLIRAREVENTARLLPVNEFLAIVRHLRHGGSLALLADQDSTRSRGIFVDFFGRPAYTPVGPAHLARRTGAPLIPIVITRDSQDPTCHRALIAEPILPDPALDEETDILRMTQDYTRLLEGWIRETPSQWVWIHDRWHHQPGKQIRVRSARRRD